MSLADALEAAASANPDLADEIRPANGDAYQLLDSLDDEAAGRLLSWLLNEAPGAAGELADAWTEEEEGIRILLAASPDGLPKSGRKVLRRVLHRLRSSGVPVAESAPSPTVVRIGGVEDRIEGAWISPLDPMGARFVYQLEPHPQGGARLFEIVVDEARGIVGFDVYSAGRSRVRSFLRDLTERDAFPAIEVGLDVARAVVARALEAHASDQQLPRGFSDWRTRVAEPFSADSRLAGSRLPGDEVAAALPVGDATPDDAVKLVEQGRIGPWPAQQEVLIALVEKLRTAADSPLIVSGATRRDQLTEIVADATDDVFDEPGRRLAAGRLRDSAWSFWKRGDEDAARACLAAAEAFTAEGSQRDNPVARILLELPLRPAIEAGEGGGKPGSEPSDAAPGETEGDDEPLIVTP